MQTAQIGLLKLLADGAGHTFVIGQPGVIIDQDLYSTKATCEIKRAYWQGHLTSFGTPIPKTTNWPTALPRRSTNVEMYNERGRCGRGNPPVLANSR